MIRPNITTVADLIAALQQYDSETVVLAPGLLHYYPIEIVRIASTEYGLYPGRKKIAIVRKG